MAQHLCDLMNNLLVMFIISTPHVIDLSKYDKLSQFLQIPLEDHQDRRCDRNGDFSIRTSPRTDRRVFATRRRSVRAGGEVPDTTLTPGDPPPSRRLILRPTPPARGNPPKREPRRRGGRTVRRACQPISYLEGIRLRRAHLRRKGWDFLYLRSGRHSVLPGRGRHEERRRRVLSNICSVIMIPTT
jgi:hypothetical protein